jgi:hypothetical protein
MMCAVEGHYVASWLTGLWSTQAKVQGNVPKVALSLGSNSSIVNGPTGEPDPTPVYVGLPTAWGSADGANMSSLCLVEELINLGL